MLRSTTRRVLPIALAWVFLFSASARADDDPTDARGAFTKGVDLVKEQQWGEALGWFERAYKLKPHALALFNMGVSELRLGRLTRARADFKKALELDAKNGHTQLAGSFAEETQGHLADIEKRLVQVTVTLTPADATLTIDGRPLAPDPDGRAGTFIAGLAAPTDAPPATGGTFTVVMDPGERDISISKEGFASQSAKPAYTPGAHADLALSLTAMPATIRVMSNVLPASVSLNEEDVGYAPVTVTRPPGTYQLTIRSVGYITYQAKVTVKEGGRSDINGNLQKEPPSIVKQWWFWTAIGVAAGGLTTITFLATRPPQPYDGGNTGWVAHPR
jgi:hypothetical protein